MNVGTIDCACDSVLHYRGAHSLQRKRVTEYISKTDTTREVHTGHEGCTHREGSDLSSEKWERERREHLPRVVMSKLSYKTSVGAQQCVLRHCRQKTQPRSGRIWYLWEAVMKWYRAGGKQWETMSARQSGPSHELQPQNPCDSKTPDLTSLLTTLVTGQASPWLCMADACNLLAGPQELGSWSWCQLLHHVRNREKSEFLPFSLYESAVIQMWEQEIILSTSCHQPDDLPSALWGT